MEDLLVCTECANNVLPSKLGIAHGEVFIKE